MTELCPRAFSCAWSLPGPVSSRWCCWPLRTGPALVSCLAFSVRMSLYLCHILSVCRLAWLGAGARLQHVLHPGTPSGNL